MIQNKKYKLIKKSVNYEFIGKARLTDRGWFVGQWNSETDHKGYLLDGFEEFWDEIEEV